METNTTMILGAIGKLGIEAPDVAFWWLLFFTEAIGPISWLVSLVLMLVFGRWLVRQIRGVVTLEQLRDEMGIGKPGSVTYEEVVAMFNWVASRRSLDKSK